MTDKNEDDLNEAIDSILAGGPATGADDESLALSRLASHLRGMPSPEFKSRLAAELLPQRRRSFLGRITVLNRIKQLASRRIAAPLAITGAAAIAAVALALVIANPLGGSTGNTAEAFGQLPLPADTNTAPSADGSGVITWQFDRDFPLPNSAPAYRLSMPEVTAARTEQIAHALGVAGAAQPLDGGSGGVAGYLVGSALDCKRVAADDACGASFVMWTSGWFTYQAGTYDDGSGTAPSDDAAKAAATAWISLSGVTNGDSYDLTIQPPPVIPDKPDGVPSDKTAPAFAQVIAQPTGHSGADNGPAIYVSVASDGSIANVGGFWAHIVAESNYTLHNSGQLLADLQAMRGTFATLETEFGDVSGADVTQDAVADIAGVSLEYRPAAPTGDESPDQVYLVPVYVLKATLTQDGQSTDGLSTNAEACSSRGSEPCGYSFGFATWIPATGPAR